MSIPIPGTKKRCKLEEADPNVEVTSGDLGVLQAPPSCCPREVIIDKFSTRIYDEHGNAL
jgi:hypothetical protein